MSRTPNTWSFFSESKLTSLVQDMTVTGLADTLGVSRSTVDRWTNGSVVPSARFQVVMSNIGTDFKGLTSSKIGRKISSFITATRIDRSEFAGLMNVSDRTVTGWIDGRSSPRNRTLLSEILTSPRP